MYTTVIHLGGIYTRVYLSLRLGKRHIYQVIPFHETRKETYIPGYTFP